MMMTIVNVFYVPSAVPLAFFMTFTYVIIIIALVIVLQL